MSLPQGERFPALSILGTSEYGLIHEAELDNFIIRWSLQDVEGNLSVFINALRSHLDDVEFCRSISSGLGLLHTEQTIDVTEIPSYIYANLEVRLKRYGVERVAEVVDLGVNDMTANGLREEHCPSRTLLLLPV
jgi:hypothetical protein